MGESRSRIEPFQFDRLNPLHALKIKNFHITTQLLKLSHLVDKTSSKEDKQRLVKNTWMSFPFVDGFWYFVRSQPFVVWNIEGYIVIKNFLIVTSIDQYFIAVDLHVMRSPPIWNGLQQLQFIKSWVDFDQSVDILAPRLTLITSQIPPKI